MLIEFRVENFRSIAEEQALTLEAAKIGGESDPRPREVEGHSAKLLPVGVIYGANASGKSNVLYALGFMREAVVNSHRSWEPEGGVPRTPFAWGEFAGRPSTFEVIFMDRGTKFQYGFSITDDEVIEEWLYAWPPPHRRKQTWFQREGEGFKFGEFLGDPNESIRQVTRVNSLFLSTAAQLKHKTLTPLYSWFRKMVAPRASRRWQFNDYALQGERAGFNPLHYAPSQAENEQNPVHIMLLKLLEAADTGIVDVRQKDTEVSAGSEKLFIYKVMLQHQRGDENSWIDLNNESEGTQTLFNIAPAIFHSLETGSLLVIDELESSLHPLLGGAILEMFNNPNSNPKNAQLLFTTHDTNLLGTLVGSPSLRRDQIWFTEKDETGQTSLYPLTDFKPRKSENLERGYLQGRYGAIPFLGSLDLVNNG